MAPGREGPGAGAKNRGFDARVRTNRCRESDSPDGLRGRWLTRRERARRRSPVRRSCSRAKGQTESRGNSRPKRGGCPHLDRGRRPTSGAYRVNDALICLGPSMTTKKQPTRAGRSTRASLNAGPMGARTNPSPHKPPNFLPVSITHRASQAGTKIARATRGSHFCDCLALCKQPGKNETDSWVHKQARSPSLILASDWITVVPSERISSAEGKVRHLCRPSTPAAQRRTSAGHGRTTAHRRVPERIPRIKPRRTVPRQFPSRTTHSRRARTHRRARWVNLYRPCPRHHRERLHARFV